MDPLHRHSEWALVGYVRPVACDADDLPELGDHCLGHRVTAWRRVPFADAYARGDSPAAVTSFEAIDVTATSECEITRAAYVGYGEICLSMCGVAVKFADVVAQVVICRPMMGTVLFVEIIKKFCR